MHFDIRSTGDGRWNARALIEKHAWKLFEVKTCRAAKAWGESQLASIELARALNLGAKWRAWVLEEAERDLGDEGVAYRGDVIAEHADGDVVIVERTAESEARVAREAEELHAAEAQEQIEADEVCAHLERWRRRERWPGTRMRLAGLYLDRHAIAGLDLWTGLRFFYDVASSTLRVLAPPGTVGHDTLRTLELELDDRTPWTITHTIWDALEAIAREWGER